MTSVSEDARHACGTVLRDAAPPSFVKDMYTLADTGVGTVVGQVVLSYFFGGFYCLVCVVVKVT